MLVINDPKIIKEYINKHIPYRLNSLMAHDLIMHRKQQNQFEAIKDYCYGDSAVVEPILEISLIFGRSLLNFIGITFDNLTASLAIFRAKKDDLVLQSLFPVRPLCPLNDDIVLANHDGFCKIIQLANKSVAHLTSVVASTEYHEYNVLPAARKGILQLVLKHLPEIDKTTVWWHNQVESLDNHYY